MIAASSTSAGAIVARKRSKGHRFLSTPYHVWDHPRYIALSDKAKVLLQDLLGQYRGFNNGDLTIVRSIMLARGWVSNDKLYKARDELLEAGFIAVARLGGMHRRPMLYALTWLNVDECNGKVEELTPSPVPLGWWKDGPPEKSPHLHTVHSAPTCGAVEQNR